MALPNGPQRSTVAVRLAYVASLALLALSVGLVSRHAHGVHTDQARHLAYGRAIAELRDTRRDVEAADRALRDFAVHGDPGALEEARRFAALGAGPLGPEIALASGRDAREELANWRDTVFAAARHGADEDLATARETAVQLAALLARLESSAAAAWDRELARAADRRGWTQALIVGVGFAALVLLAVLQRLASRFDRQKDIALEAAARAEQRFRGTLAGIGDAVIVTDADGRIEFVNEAARGIAGVDPSDVGRASSDVLRWVDARSGQAVSDPLADARRVSGLVWSDAECALLLRDGEMRYVEACAAGLRDADGRSLGAVVVVRDTSERRRAEAEIAGSRERFRSLVLATSEVVWTMAADGIAREDSPTWREATGQTYEQWQGLGWLDAVHPEDRAAVHAAWNAAVAERRRFEAEYRLRHANGEYRWSAAHAVPVRDADGTVREWVGTNVDIEERRLAEQRQERAARRKDEFLALLAHELRNPLAPLRNSLEVLREDAPASLHPTLDMMGRHLRHLVRLLDDLLDSNRIGRGKLVLRRQTVDLASCVEQAVESTRAEFRRAGQQLDVTLPDGPLWVDGDATRLTQVVTNLLDNARKYSARGATTWVRAERVANRARVVVRDAGQGIHADVLPTIFEPFHERPAPADEEAAARDPGGLGIGLSLVRSLVDMHGGSVAAESAGPGTGAQFTVWLPTVAAPAPSAAPPERRGRPVRSLRVLIVEDNEDAAESLGLLLRMRGHDVRVAHRGEDGLRALDEYDAELVICDIRMPGMNGLELARRVRRRGGERPLLVALTGFGGAEDRLRSAAAGFDVHALKPLDPRRLDDVLRRAAERRDTARTRT